MVKVRILRGVTAASAAALGLASLTGCTADADDSIGEASDNNTESIAGSGQLTLHGWTVHYQSTSGGDEFLRVGERMKMAVDYNHLVFLLAGYDDPALATELRADPSKVKLAVQIQYRQFDGTTADAAPIPMTVAPGASNQNTATSAEFVIPKGAARLRAEIVAQYEKAGIPQTTHVLQKAGVGRTEFVVFGAYLPNKLALFDTMGAERRSRVVEGGALVPGAQATLSVTDWRLDTVVDKTTLDLRVGQKQSGSRFGPVVVDALGSLEYEVEAAVSTDNGATYSTVRFTKKDRPDVLAQADGFRYALEAALGIPQGATGLKIAFHVKAFLQVPNYYPGDIQNARYAPGSRILLRDVWDNNDGRDYALPISAQ